MNTKGKPTALTAQFTDTASPRLPLRVTVKVKGVLPLLPSVLLASVAAMSSTGEPSSFSITP